MKSIDSETRERIVLATLADELEELILNSDISVDEARVVLQDYRMGIQRIARDSASGGQRAHASRVLLPKIDQAQKWLKTESRTREDQLLAAIRRHKARTLGTTYYRGYEGPGPDHFNDELWKELEK